MSGDLPRGLWVGKLGRPGRPKRDLSAVPVGKRPWDVWPGDFFPYYYFRIVKAGEKVVQRCLETGDFREAVKRARVEHELHTRARYDARAAALAGLDGARRRVGSAGDVFAAFLAVMPGNRRAVQSARRVVALARGWVAPVGVGERAGKEAIREGSDVAARVDGLPWSEVFSADVVRGYFTACQGGRFDPVRRARVHLVYNKTLKFARELFSRTAMEHCYGGIGLESGEVERFLKFPLLKEEAIDTREAAIDPGAVRGMIEGARALESGEDAGGRELGRVNRLFRLLGLRTKELLFARVSWLWREPMGGRWYLDIRPRPEEGFQIKGKEAGQVPLCEELLGMIRGLPQVMVVDGVEEPAFLVLPGARPTVRAELVEGAHNEWLKGCIGEVYSGQGNHRLRKHVASFLAEKYGEEIAASYLRHGDASRVAKTARDHYIARRFAALPVVTDEDLLGWGAPAGNDEGGRGE